MDALWYMRDNHTFRKLPEDPEAAIQILREEVLVHGSTYGMLGTRRPGVKPLHCGGIDTATKFLGEAWDWLKERHAQATETYSI